MLVLAALPACAQFTSLPSASRDGLNSVLAEFAFDEARGDEPVSPPTHQPERALVSGMQRGSGVEASPIQGGFGAAGWTKAAAPDQRQFFEFTIAPDAGWSLNLHSLTVTEKRIGSGAREWSVRSSLDGFAQDLARFQTTPSEGAAGMPSVVALGSEFVGLKQAVTFRLFGFSAPADRIRVIAGWPISLRVPAAANGSWFLDNLAVQGSVVPEPAALGWVVGLGLAGFAVLRRRRRA